MNEPLSGPQGGDGKLADPRAAEIAGLFLSNSHYLGKVPDKDIEWTLRNGAEAVHLFFEAVKHRARTVIRHVPGTKIDPWKSIPVGNMTASELCDLVEKKYHLGIWSRYLIKHPSFSVENSSGMASLAALPLEFFGFDEPVRTDVFLDTDFLARWSEKNLGGSALKLCLPEDAYQLRLLYDSQPCGEILWLAMKPFEDTAGNHRILCVRRRNKGRRWINACQARAGARWSLGVKFLFRVVELG